MFATDTVSVSTFFDFAHGNSRDAVLWVDQHLNVQFANAAAADLWHCPVERLKAQQIPALMSWPPLTAIQPKSPLKQLCGQRFRSPIVLPDGHHRWCEASLSALQPLEGFEPLYSLVLREQIQQMDDPSHLKLLAEVAEQTDNAVLITNAAWQVMYINPGFTKMFGFSNDDFLGGTPTQILAPYAERGQVEELRTQLLEGKSFHSEELVYTREGHRLWCSITTNPVMNEHGELAHVLAVLTDITYPKIHEVLQNRMLASIIREDSLESMMNQFCHEVEVLAPDVRVAVIRVDDKYIMHPVAGPSLGKGFLSSIEGIKAEDGLGTCGTAIVRGETTLSEDIETDELWEGIRHLALDEGLRACWSIPVMSSSGRALGSFAFYYRSPRSPSPLHRKIAEIGSHLCSVALEREEARQHIRQLAFYDSLTGLPNRSLLFARADQALATARRQQQPLSVFFIDLDHFKRVNDSLGHPAGDELLRTIAKRLNEGRRGEDIVARLSGDEFVMILPQCSRENAISLTNVLTQRLTEPCYLANTPLVPSASIGVSIFPEDGEDFQALLHNADTAMYRAKHQGRCQASFFKAETDDDRQTASMVKALREAIACDALTLHYQPQLDLQGHELFGVEAFARWFDSRFGQVPPERFIPLAETHGLIDDIGHWVLTEACRQLAAWREEGLKVPTMAINLSAINFHDPELPDLIRRLLKRFELGAGDITIELTEAALLDKHPVTRQVLEELHQLGVHLIMDDFGNGYASLNHLSGLPLKGIKLDRQLVARLTLDGGNNQALSQAVQRIGDSLHLQVVAEGVETDEQRLVLQRQGYLFGQGYLFSRPGAADVVAAFLRAL
ncbi:EAL domain-containing protein [Pokkaliibacter sp. CJK22405]|uniref:bifunctional diguanylate cyclase/phosphodiesterase n=1 Tax=Pokkaliibacter sp. CJK22405 TaxID=3384615 RepID=UPI0039851305